MYYVIGCIILKVTNKVNNWKIKEKKIKLHEHNLNTQYVEMI